MRSVGGAVHPRRLRSVVAAVTLGSLLAYASTGVVAAGEGAGAPVAPLSVADPPAEAGVPSPSASAFTSTGRWGTFGSAAGQFNAPQGVAASGAGDVYVADGGNNRIQQFTGSGTFVRAWGGFGTGNGEFYLPFGVAVGGSGDVYVSDFYHHRIQEFAPTGTFVRTWGTPGPGEGQFAYPAGIAVAGSGDVYVVDNGNHRVQEFSSAGAFVRVWGGYGSGDGQFINPTGVAVGGGGHVYVTDQDRHRVQEFTATGSFVRGWGTQGSGDGQFNQPSGVAVDGSGTVYVVETGNHRVQWFASQGVSGTVTEQGSGDPVAGAWIAVLSTSDFSIAGGAVADGSGVYGATLAPGSYYLYLVDPTGVHPSGFHGPPATVTVTTGGVVDADPVMTTTRGSVTGTVTETGSGTPISGAWALALSTGVANTGATEVVTATNGSGVFSLPGLRQANHFVGVVDPTGSHVTRFYPNSPNVPDATQVGVTAGNATVADLSLPAQAPPGTGAAVTGTVTEQGTGTSLPGIHVVALRASDYAMVRGAVTNGSGAYSLDVTAGGYKLAILDSTGLHDMEWFDNLASTGLGSAVTVTAPGVADAALDANTGRMSGTITDDPSGDPVAGAWVIAIGPTGIAGGAVTAADGTYTVTGLAPGTYRATFADPNGGRVQEYWDDSPDFTGATTFNVTAAGSVTVSAALALPAP